LTTAAGLLSFTTADLKPIIQLGVFAAVGVVMAFLFTMTVLPAALAVLPIRGKRRDTSSEHPHLDRALLGLGHIATAQPRKVVVLSAGLLILGLFGALQLRISYHSLEWFPEGDPLRVATNEIDRELRGSMVLEFVLHTGRENALHDPALLQKLEQLSEYALSFRRDELYVAKTTSIVDIVKEIHQALNEDRSEYYVIPRDRQLLAQELLLFENSGSDDLEDVTDLQFSQAGMTLRLPRVDAVWYADLIDEFQAPVRTIVGEYGDVVMTGAMALLGRISRATAISMIRSYLFALLAITPIMILLLGSVRGLVSMIPNVAPIILSLGLMYWWEIPLDATTVLVGSIILGLAVDDTIHFMHKFNRYFDDTGDARLAVQLTLQTTGAALLFTSLVLAAGFLVLTFGYMVNVSYFGVILAFATLTAFLADVLLAPALMTLVTRRETVVQPGPAVDDGAADEVLVEPLKVSFRK
jgi:predicted RND superfamily exporter protein